MTASPSTPSHAEPSDATAVAGYLFAYFAGEQDAQDEEVRFALSDGPDPLRWRRLPGLGTLASTVGTTGVRDPFVVRLGTGGGFALIGTDLRVHGGPGWDAAVRRGSRDLLVWRSEDLLTWAGPDAVTVMPPGAGCVWAPEAVLDPDTGEHLVFWASTVYGPDDPDHAGDSHHRMFASRTRDFRAFTPAAVWLDAGTATIDSTVVRDDDGLYYRFTKDERDDGSTGAKYVVCERSRELAADRWEPVARAIGSPAPGRPGLERAEGPIVVRHPAGDGWYLFLDEFGGRGYVPLRADRLDAPAWSVVEDHALPAGCRHGSVLALTAEEYRRLLPHRAGGG